MVSQAPLLATQVFHDAGPVLIELKTASFKLLLKAAKAKDPRGPANAVVSASRGALETSEYETMKWLMSAIV